MIHSGFIVGNVEKGNKGKQGHLYRLLRRPQERTTASSKAKGRQRRQNKMFVRNLLGALSDGGPPTPGVSVFFHAGRRQWPRRPDRRERLIIFRRRHGKLRGVHSRPRLSRLTFLFWLGRFHRFSVRRIPHRFLPRRKRRFSASLSLSPIPFQQLIPCPRTNLRIVPPISGTDAQRTAVYRGKNLRT